MTDTDPRRQIGAEAETGELVDMVRLTLRRAVGLLGTGFRADVPPTGLPMWAGPLTITSESTGRQWMLELKAVDCTGWMEER